MQYLLQMKISITEHPWLNPYNSNKERRSITLDSTVWNTDTIVLLAAILLISGVITTKFSARLGVPSLVLFIIVGMVLGQFIYFDNAGMAQMIGVFALIIILFEGGLQTRWSTFRPVILPSLSLATLGVLLTTAIVGVGVKFILGLGWAESMLFGAIVGSTDAAAVFAVLKGQNIHPKMAATLESESGSNDPMAVFLTVAMIELITVPDFNILSLIGSFFVQMSLGIVFGVIFGQVAVWSLNRISLDSSGLYPVFATAFALITYGLTAFFHGSGLLAVYVAGIVIGNAEIAYRQSIFRFSEGFAWMMQILMFVILGLLVFPSELFTLTIFLKGMAIAAFLMLVARPIAVYISTIKMGFTNKELLFLSWAGLKGAVPIVLATFPLISNIEGSYLIFNAVFFVVLTNCLVQGSTITPVAEKLGLIGPKKSAPTHSLELISLGKADAEMIEYEMEEDAVIIGKALHEITFPEGVLVNAIIRKDTLITPKGSTVIHAEDILYILTTRKHKKQLTQLLQKKQITVEKQPDAAAN